MEKDAEGREKRNKKRKKKGRRGKGRQQCLCPKKLKVVSHRPQSVNEPVNPCNKLLGRDGRAGKLPPFTKQAQKERERARESEGGRTKREKL